MRSMVFFALVVTMAAGCSSGPECGSGTIEVAGQCVPVDLPNSPPAIETVTLTPANPTTVDDLTVAVSGVTDTDGDTVEFQYSWTVNGDAVVGDAVLSSDQFARGDTVAVAVTPFDGQDEGIVRSAETAVENARPTVLSVGIHPAVPTSADDLTASAFALDVDGDPVEYAYVWSVDGVDAGTGAVLSAPNARGSEVRVTARANDGDGVSAPLTSDPVTLDNSAPETPAQPSLVADTTWFPSGLTCTVAPVFDADADSLTYEVRFLLDGVEQVVLPAPGGVAMLSASEVDTGFWSCEGRADDGLEVTPWSAPSMPIVQTCVPHSITLTAFATGSLAYNNDTWWDDSLLRAYTHGSAGGNEDIVGWMLFDLSDAPGAGGIVDAELEVYVTVTYGAPEIAAVQTSGVDWGTAIPISADLPRTGEISAARTDLVEGWEAFPIDGSAWTDRPTEDHPVALIGIDNLAATYSYVYGHTSTSSDAPRLHLTLCY